jgi:hypothetical protein
MSEIRPGQTGEPSTNGTAQPRQRKEKSRRLERIRDYQRQALAHPDALLANLGAINSDLMKLAYRLLQSTNSALARCRGSQEDVEAVLPTVGVCSQIARQVDRLAQLEWRLRVPQAGGAAQSSHSAKSRSGEEYQS